jgi:hypothetical protein
MTFSNLCGFVWIGTTVKFEVESALDDAIMKVFKDGSMIPRFTRPKQVSG